MKGWIPHTVDVNCDFGMMSGHCEEPVELPEEPEPTDGPSVPFRLTEAKLGHEQTGDQPYFGRINMKACVVRDSVHLYVYRYMHSHAYAYIHVYIYIICPQAGRQTRPDQTDTTTYSYLYTHTHIYIYICISIISVYADIQIDLSSVQHTLMTTGWAGSITYTVSEGF